MTASDAKVALALHVERNIPNQQLRRELSKKVAAYVAATVREDRANRKEPSLFDSIFGAFR